MVRRWIRRDSSVPAGEVDDLTQEVFLRLLRYSDDVIVENPAGYLFTVAMRVVGAWRTRARVRMPHGEEGLEALQIDAEEEPESVFERAQACELVQAAVRRLPTRQREILLLHVREGLTYKQIAQQKGLTYRIVLRDLTRAYVTLKTQLSLKEH
jgi:RNA polymerase sigma-70 factor (ECF subfamily)